MSDLHKRSTRQDRKRRIRSKMAGTLERPRASVFRSNRGITVQLIDDENGRTLVAVDARKVKKTGLSKGELAEAIGQQVAKEASEKKISKIVFDRGGYKYHGRVKIVADAIRAGGLEF